MQDVAGNVATRAAVPADRPSLAGARVFVTLVFFLLAGGFLASTWLLFAEFRQADAMTLAIAHSHLFLFFPTFGILALAAFYLPSVIFTHLYWSYIPLGRIRFLFGFAVVIAISAWVSLSALGEAVSPRAIWEVRPEILRSDLGAPRNCVANGRGCERGGVLPVLQTMRVNAQRTASLSKFGRACTSDQLLEERDENSKDRWCFPANQKLNAARCCEIQKAYSATIDGYFKNPATRSDLSRFDLYLQPIKTFFIVVVLVIGIMLVVWQKRVAHYYPDLTWRMERHIFIGALAMLLWPVMDYAYLDTTNALFGRLTSDLQFRLSLVVAPWAMLLLFYYLQRFARRVEVIGQIITVAGTLLAVVARDEIKDWAVRLVGVGMPWWMAIVLAVAWVAGMLAVISPERWMPKPAAATDKR